MSCTDCSLGEVSATSKDSQRNMCTSHSTTQLSSCNDHVSVDSSGHQRSHTVDRSRRLSVCTVSVKSLINCDCKKLLMCTYNGKRSFCCNVCSKIVCTFLTFKCSHAQTLWRTSALYYHNMVEWFCWDSSLMLTTNWFRSVLWHCWFGHLACKNRFQNDYNVLSETLSLYTTSTLNCYIICSICRKSVISKRSIDPS